MSEILLYVWKALFGGGGAGEKLYHLEKRDVNIPRDVASGLVVTPSTSLNVDTSGLRASSIPKASSTIRTMPSGTATQLKGVIRVNMTSGQKVLVR